MPAGRHSVFMPLSSEAHEVRYMARRCPLWSPGTEDEVRLMFVGELRSSEGLTEGWYLTVNAVTRWSPNPLARR